MNERKGRKDRIGAEFDLHESRKQKKNKIKGRTGMEFDVIDKYKTRESG